MSTQPVLSSSTRNVTNDSQLQHQDSNPSASSCFQRSLSWVIKAVMCIWNVIKAIFRCIGWLLTFGTYCNDRSNDVQSEPPIPQNNAPRRRKRRTYNDASIHSRPQSNPQTLDTPPPRPSTPNNSPREAKYPPSSPQLPPASPTKSLSRVTQIFASTPEQYRSRETPVTKAREDDGLLVERCEAPAEKCRCPQSEDFRWASDGDVEYIFPKPLLDLNAFIDQCAPNRQAMIYGLGACKFKEIGIWLKEQTGRQFDDVFTWEFGDKNLKFTLKDRDVKDITQIVYSSANYFKGASKAGLTNMVIENIKRAKLGLSRIPVIFIIGKDGIRLDIQRIISRGLQKSKQDNITDAEIRRAYKLCFDPRLNNEEIYNEARKTFLFVSLTKNKCTDPVFYRFTIHPNSPWDSEEWKKGWSWPEQTKRRVGELTTCWRRQVLSATLAKTS